MKKRLLIYMSIFTLSIQSLIPSDNLEDKSDLELLTDWCVIEIDSWNSEVSDTTKEYLSEIQQELLNEYDNRHDEDEN